MCLEYKKISDFDRGVLFQLLKDAYSFNQRCGMCWESDWKEFDNFFYDNLEIADKYGFITTLDGEPIGHISWDPRNIPDYVEIGHNCIATRYKGKGYGKMQLSEALRRIYEYHDLKKIVATTNAITLSAQKNYESVGFMLKQKRENMGPTDFSGEYMDYEMLIRDRQSTKRQENFSEKEE